MFVVTDRPDQTAILTWATRNATAIHNGELNLRSGKHADQVVKTLISGDGWTSENLAVGAFAYAGTLTIHYRDAVKVVQQHYLEGLGTPDFHASPVERFVREPDPNLPVQNGMQGKEDVRAYGHPMTGERYMGS